MDMDRYNPISHGVCALKDVSIDSMFLQNVIATAGGEMVGKLEGFEKDKLSLIYDCEPRKPETISKNKKPSRMDFNICRLAE